MSRSVEGLIHSPASTAPLAIAGMSSEAIMDTTETPISVYASPGRPGGVRNLSLRKSSMEVIGVLNHPSASGPSGMIWNSTTFRPRTSCQNSRFNSLPPP